MSKDKKHEHDKHHEEHKHEHEHDHKHHEHDHKHDHKHKHHDHKHDKHKHDHEHKHHEHEPKHHHDHDHKPPHVLLEEMTNKYRMILAEMENQRKRFEMEKQEHSKYSNFNLISDLMPSIELFETVLNSKNVSEEIKKWLKGYEMIFHQIWNVLEKEGIKKIQPHKGDEFDSRYHQAVDSVEAEDVKAGHIVNTIKPGYLLRDRLVQPAMVNVSKHKTN